MTSILARCRLPCNARGIRECDHCRGPGSVAAGLGTQRVHRGAALEGAASRKLAPRLSDRSRTTCSAAAMSVSGVKPTRCTAQKRGGGLTAALSPLGKSGPPLLLSTPAEPKEHCDARLRALTKLPRVRGCDSAAGAGGRPAHQPAISSANLRRPRRAERDQASCLTCCSRSCSSWRQRSVSRRAGCWSLGLNGSGRGSAVRSAAGDAGRVSSRRPRDHRQRHRTGRSSLANRGRGRDRLKRLQPRRPARTRRRVRRVDPAAPPSDYARGHQRDIDRDRVSDGRTRRSFGWRGPCSPALPCWSRICSSPGSARSA